MKDKNEVVYTLNIEDIQTVAVQEIDRELTDDEIEKIKDLISEKINWYDAILNSILEEIKLSNVQ
jgi:DNA replicative helicase MCM subunit Mcm2 (Cdc46/Mcm family)